MFQSALEVKADTLAHKNLISPTLWERMCGKIVRDEGVDRSVAERIINESLAFLLMCAKNPAEPQVPSAMVDIGWHTFILYTKEYADFCAQHAGSFIHHTPSDEPGVHYPKGGARRTMEAMQLNGFIVDEMLWASAGDCSAYCSGDSCSGGGR